MIKINDTWALESDPYCWHLIQSREKIAETGKNKGQPIVTKTVTYHPSICAALRHAMDYDARLCDSFADVLAGWHSVQADFARAVSK